MKAVQRMLLHMVPVLESTVDTSTVGDIGTVPAVRVELGFENDYVATVGVIDTGAELSVLDETIHDQLHQEGQHSLATSVRIATGLSKQIVKMYHLNVRICGESSDESLIFSSVPVAVTKLARPHFIIGRRGLLEWVKVELDFPRRLVTLDMTSSGHDLYPALSQVFPSLGSALEAFNAGQNAQGIMLLAWEMEKFLDRLVSEGTDLESTLSAKDLERATLEQKLKRICNELGITDLSKMIAKFANARNAAAHAIGSGVIEYHVVLSAAESIVARILAWKVKSRR